MKIILSRKGFDSASGGYPSPIMPDGTLLSLPIPGSENYYETLKYKDKNYAEIINELTDFSGPTAKCHYDPDIREGAIDANYCPKEWRPAFGQKDSALSHLMRQGVEAGDIFLFFGLFRKAELAEDGRYRYVKGAPLQHIIWGYMQVGEIIHNPTTEEYPWLANGSTGQHKHPHLDRSEKHNAIFIGAPHLFWDSSKKGVDCLKYDDRLVLTKKGMSVSCWELPDFFREIEISYHSKNSWKEGYFKSAGRGQEFVFSVDDNPEAIAWVRKIIGAPREKRPRITPENIKTLAPDEIFVFGSNSEGRHGGGAAAQAMKWGARWGQAEGLQGNTYAIPTMFGTAAEVKPYVDRFIEFAKSNPTKRFLVTKIGCGIAGFDVEQIAPLFERAVAESIENICLPEEFLIINISNLGVGKD